MFAQLRKSHSQSRFNRDCLVALSLVGSAYALVTLAGFAAAA